MIKKVLVTGASGFIGSRLSEYLLDHGCEVVAFARGLPAPMLDHNHCKQVRGDILNPDDLRVACRGVDAVFHCAALISFVKKDLDKLYDVNVNGARNVFGVAYECGVKKVVHISACAVLGYSIHGNELIDETSSAQISANNVYAYTKAKAEKVAACFIKKGLNISVANIATVYGAGDHGLNSGKLIKLIKEGLLFFIPPGGTSYVDIDDLVKGLVLLAEKGALGQRYIFVNANFSYQELINRIAGFLKVRPPFIRLPQILFYPALRVAGVMEYVQGFLGNKIKISLLTENIVREIFGYKYYNNARACRELGWIPKHRIEDSLKKALAYYRENKMM